MQILSLDSKKEVYFILERMDLICKMNAILLLATCVQLERYQKMSIFNILRNVIGPNSYLILNKNIWNPANCCQIPFWLWVYRKVNLKIKSQLSGKYLEGHRLIHKIPI